LFCAWESIVNGLLVQYSRPKDPCREAEDPAQVYDGAMRYTGTIVFVKGADPIPIGSRNASEDAKLFFGQAIQKIVA